MSQEQIETTGNIDTTAPQTTAGELLRRARESAGVHIATLAVQLKVSPKKLEALEGNDWTQLPDPVFVRALATSVCRQIKADPAPILALMPKNEAQRLIRDGVQMKGLNQSFSAPSSPKPSGLNLALSPALLLGAVVLLLGAVVLIFLPNLIKPSTERKVEEVSIAAPTASTAPAMPALPVSSVPAEPLSPAVPLSQPAPSVAVSPVPTQSPVVALPTPPVAPTPPAAPTPPVAPTPTPAPVLTPPPAPVVASASPAVAGAPMLKMIAKGQVWIEVKDGKGQVVVQRVLRSKEEVVINGVAPLSVVIGRINEIASVDVRGKPFSLAGISPDNVARFEVK